MVGYLADNFPSGADTDAWLFVPEWSKFEGSLRERVRCSSLVDWPVYPRLKGTMRASNGAQI